MPVNIDQKSIAGQSLRCLEINPEAQKALVVLHGWGGCLDSWKNFLTTLENENLHILTFDLPGFGLSPKPEKAWQIKDYAKLVKNFIGIYNLKKINLLGHSFGGQIATQFAYDYPEELEKLFLVGAAAIRSKSTAFKNFLKIIAKATQKIWPKPIRRFLYKLLGNLDYGELNNPIMKQTMQNAISADLQNILPEIKTPTINPSKTKNRYE